MRLIHARLMKLDGRYENVQARFISAFVERPHDFLRDSENPQSLVVHETIAGRQICVDIQRWLSFS